MFELLIIFFLLYAGQFLLSLSQQHGSVAQVVSEWIGEKTASCFTLWYHMENRSAQKNCRVMAFLHRLTWCHNSEEGCTSSCCSVSSRTSSRSVNKCQSVMNHLLHFVQDWEKLWNRHYCCLLLTLTHIQPFTTDQNSGNIKEIKPHWLNLGSNLGKWKDKFLFLGLKMLDFLVGINRHHHLYL